MKCVKKLLALGLIQQSPYYGVNLPRLDPEPQMGRSRKDLSAASLGGEAIIVFGNLNGEGELVVIRIFLQRVEHASAFFNVDGI